MKNIILVVGLMFCVLALFGCATAPYAPSAPATMGMPGIYHHVERGQTLWRISKIYDVDLDEIVRINRISEASNIEVGQLIFIPNRARPQYPEYKSYGESDDFIWPMKGKIISRFGQTHNNTVNKGLDIQPSVSDNVVAARTGKVVFCADDFNGYGKTVILDHGDGFMSVYAGNSTILVRPGDKVQKGYAIAKISANGRSNTYLHLEIRKGNIAQNPYFYISR